MRQPHTTTEIWTCIFYVLFLIALALGVQVFISRSLDIAIYPMFNWFNSLALIWKVIILLVGGTVVVYIIAALVGLVHALFVLLLFKKLPRNSAVNIIAALLFYANVFLCIRSVYVEMPSWKIWFILEFILLCIFCIAANYPLLYTINKGKKEDSLQ